MGPVHLLPPLIALPLWLAAIAAHVQPAQSHAWLLLLLALALVLLLLAALLLHGMAGLLAGAGLALGAWLAPLPLALLLAFGGWLALALLLLLLPAVRNGHWLRQLARRLPPWLAPPVLLALPAALWGA